MKRLLLLLAFLAGCGTEQPTSNVDIIGGEKIPSDPTKPSAFPSAIGLKIESGAFYGNCTGTRIGANTYLTAAHCFDHINGAKEAGGSVFASNTLPIEGVRFANVSIHPTYRQASSAATRGVDLATFTIQFPATAHKELWDKFVSIAPIQYTKPVIGLPVRLAGYGCAQKDFGMDSPVTGLPLAKCTEFPDFRYMKTAQNRILKIEEQSFYLDGSTNKEMVTGFISNGDSGGPVFAENGSLVGVTSAGTNGLLAFEDGYGINTIHMWLGYPAAQSFIGSALSDDSKKVPFQMYVEFQNVVYPDGGTYRGAMRVGLRDGTGKMFYPDGRVYDGAWSLDQRYGYGEQSWHFDDPKYVDYKGMWEGNLPSGKGRQTYKDKTIYDGFYQSGRYHGTGTMFYPNGDKREGSWAANKMTGEITLTTASGEKWLETYSDGTRISAVKL